MISKKIISRLVLAPLALLLPGITLAHSGEHQTSFLFNLLHPLLGPEFTQLLTNPISLLVMASAAMGIVWSLRS